MAEISAGVKTRSRKRLSRGFSAAPTASMSTMSLPSSKRRLREVAIFHLGERGDDLPGYIAGAAHSRACGNRLDHAQVDIKLISAMGKIRIFLLQSSAKKYAEHAGPGRILYDGAHAIAEILGVDAADPAAPALGKNQDGMPLAKQEVHFAEHALHVFARTAPHDGQAAAH